MSETMIPISADALFYRSLLFELTQIYIKGQEQRQVLKR